MEGRLLARRGSERESIWRCSNCITQEVNLAGRILPNAASCNRAQRKGLANATPHADLEREILTNLRGSAAEPSSVVSWHTAMAKPAKT